ncbi:hypothetical protein [Marinoscillum furvescens]|uniref:Uncharacterized protein n=1 Tax=Marinoscillum furvescens DSM 4134 TaxID=1122208 RepID=A0A3D9L1X7_MARFU|nr:hypothetical protein [Marinoscillum furvescens]RED97912.1 hypothetical protein C7460_11153 [Marinoscillum furvescens DSM 4134]
MPRFVLLLVALTFAIYTKMDLRQHTLSQQTYELRLQQAEQHAQQFIRTLQSETMDCHLQCLNSGANVPFQVSDCAYEVFEKYHRAELTAMMNDLAGVNLR